MASGADRSVVRRWATSPRSGARITSPCHGRIWWGATLASRFVATGTWPTSTIFTCSTTTSTREIFLHSDICNFTLMRTESRIIQFFEGILHVIVTEELHNTSAILEHIGKTHISSFTHVVLEILPTARWGKTWHQNSVLWAPSRWSSTSTSTTAGTWHVTTAATHCWPTSSRKLDS